MSHILLVEDDPILGEGLKTNLELEEYEVTWCKNISSAKSAIDNFKFDLILLDLGLPDGSGIDLCHQIRLEQLTMPVIILTAQGDEDMVVKGFEVGANDYVKKPFSGKELFARINSQLTVSTLSKKVIELEKLTLEIENRRALYDGKEFKINRREFDILQYFMNNIDRVVTRETMIAQLNYDEDINDRTIDSHISHLRKKMKNANIEKILIKAEYGVGHRLILND